MENNNINVVDDSILLNSKAMEDKETSFVQQQEQQEQQEQNTLQSDPSNDVKPFDDQNTALNVLVQAVHIGQQRGIWKLNESVILQRAINTFKSSTPPTPPSS